MQASSLSSPPFVTILILNWNGKQLLSDCLHPLLKQTYKNYHVILIDNASSDDSVAFVRAQFPSVEVVENDHNVGFAKGNNVGLRLPKVRSADYTILLNNDVVVPHDWLATFVAEMEQIPNLGVAGCKLLFPNGTIQHLGGVVKFPEVVAQHPHQFEADRNQISQAQDADYVTGAAFAISRQALETVGVLDELFSPFYFEEVDYCYRVRAVGLRVVLLPNIVAMHDESATMNLTGNRARLFHLNRLRFALRYVPIDLFDRGFVVAETRRLQKADVVEQILMRELCLQVLLELPRTISAERPSTDLIILQRGLLKLRDALDAVPSVAVVPSAADEWVFASAVPIFGRLIAKTRTAWFSMGAKWPLKAALDEQRALNQQLIEAQTTLLARQQGMENVIGQLSAEVARLQQAQRDQSNETR
ncbi:MAG: glycosyltransferase family 2 protein [Candidatus Promineifilaceae bacterium]